MSHVCPKQCFGEFDGGVGGALEVGCDRGVGVGFRARGGGGTGRCDGDPDLFRVGGIDQFGAGRGRGERRGGCEGQAGPPCEVPHIAISLPISNAGAGCHESWSTFRGLAWPGTILPPAPARLPARGANFLPAALATSPEERRGGETGESWGG